MALISQRHYNVNLPAPTSLAIRARTENQRLTVLDEYFIRVNCASPDPKEYLWREWPLVIGFLMEGVPCFLRLCIQYYGTLYLFSF